MEGARKAALGHRELSLSTTGWMERAADVRFVRPMDINIPIAIDAFNLVALFYNW